jgi:hypothetical protein
MGALLWVEAGTELEVEIVRGPPYSRSSFHSTRADTMGFCFSSHKKAMFLNSMHKASCISVGSVAGGAAGAGSWKGGNGAGTGAGGANVEGWGAAGAAARVGVAVGAATWTGAPPRTARRSVTTIGSPPLPPRCKIIVTGEFGGPRNNPCASSTCAPTQTRVRQAESRTRCS